MPGKTQPVARPAQTLLQKSGVTPVTRINTTFCRDRSNRCCDIAI